LPGSSFGPAMYPSSDIDMQSTDAVTSTSCGLDPNWFQCRPGRAALLIGQPC
jgi:hypothetical protein